MLNYQTPVLLVCEDGKEEEAMIRLLRVGFENVAGFLDGGFETWNAAGEPVSIIKSVNPQEINQMMADGWKVLDVRKPGEFENGHIRKAKTLHLQILENRIDELDPDTSYLIHCAGGYRSMIAASIMARKGYKNFVNVNHGWGAIQHIEGLEMETGPCEIEIK